MKTRDESGAVLLVVLVALALLAALAGVALRLGQAGLQGLVAERAVFSRDTLEQSALAAIGARLGADLPRDGTPVVLDLPGGQVEARVIAAEGLVNPAHARLPVLQAMLDAAGASPEQARRLAQAIVAARGEKDLAGPWSVAPLFAADAALWPKVAGWLTFLGARSTVDPAVAPAPLREAMRGIQAAGVDLTQTRPAQGLYEIDLRVLAPARNPTTAAATAAATATGPFSHFSVLRDRAGRIHVFARTWPEERAP